MCLFGECEVREVRGSVRRSVRSVDGGCGGSVAECDVVVSVGYVPRRSNNGRLNYFYHGTSPRIDQKFPQEQLPQVLKRSEVKFPDSRASS
jgi:hypothetical protein